MSSVIRDSEITINANVISHIARNIKRQQVNVEDLLSRCDIKLNDLARPNFRVPITNAVKLCQLARQITNDECIGAFSKPQSLGFFKILVLSAIHMPTLGDAIRRMIEFNNIINDNFTLSLSVDKRNAEITFSRVAPAVTETSDAALDIVMGTAHRLSNWLCNELIFLNKIEFESSIPSFHKEYQYIFYGAPSNFDCSTSRFTFDERYLSLAIMQTEASAAVYLKHIPLDLFLPQDVQGEISQAVRGLLKECFKSKKSMGLQEVSASLGISTQTVRRYLVKEGSSFNAIKSQVKRDIAIHALGNPALSVEEVSYHAGYSDSASFIRAFKSWTGFTPTKFRQTQLPS